jgi:hypothetical protein
MHDLNISRRSLAAGLALAPLAGLRALAAPSELESLIAAHRGAVAEFIAVIDDLEKAEGFDEGDEAALEAALEVVSRRWDRLNEAERDAAMAICSHRCANLDEARAKAAYIVKSQSIMDALDSHGFGRAILESFIAGGEA